MDKSKDTLIYHSKTLLARLNELRKNDNLVDTTLIVEGVHIKAHRVVLATRSEYFAAMCSIKESKQLDIVLPDVSAKAMNMLLEYIYTSNLPLNNDNVQEVLSAAIHTQMKQVVATCCSYLENHVSLQNWTDTAFWADMYQFEELKEKVYRLLCSRFKEFSETPEFQNITCKQLEYALNSDFPVDCSEDTIVEIVADYCLTHNVSSEWVRKLFSGIQFKQIHNIDLNRLPNFNRIANSENAEPFLRELYSDLMKLENEQEYLSYISSLPAENIVRNTRGMQLTLIAIGGFRCGVPNDKVRIYLPNRDKWLELASISNITHYYDYRAAVIGKEMFIVGGLSATLGYTKGDSLLTSKYNVATNKWNSCAGVPTSRCRFSLHAVGKYLYVIGGEMNYFQYELGYIRRCERYNSLTNEWDSVTPLPEPRSFHSGTNYKLFLYISGGIHSSIVLDSFWCYDILQDSWHQKKPMLKPRAEHVLVTADDQIYACGGWYRNNLGKKVVAPTIEVYDIKTDSWRLETTNPEPSFYMGITVLERKIYFVGGHFPDYIPGWRNYQSKIQVYDLTTKNWSTRDLPANENTKWRRICNTIYVPTEVVDKMIAKKK